MASLKGDNRTLVTRLYIVFNHEGDESARRCPEHLNSIFEMLHKILYTQSAHGSPKMIPNDLFDDLYQICEVIHNYSFDIFVHRVNKHKHWLSSIQEYIEQG